MSKLFENVLEKSNGLVLMGDFNLNQLRSDNMTKSTEDICQTFNIHQFIDLPTRITDNSSPLIYMSDSTFVTQNLL